MEREKEIEEIVARIKRLDPAGRLVVLKEITAISEQEEPKKGRRGLLSLRGLGAEIWKNIDVDKYIEEERQWD
ncbi:hypothetical protein BH24BAC1_BH24BAC1_24090 [soil metagenome]